MKSRENEMKNKKNDHASLFENKNIVEKSPI